MTAVVSCAASRIRLLCEIPYTVRFPAEAQQLVV